MDNHLLPGPNGPQTGRDRRPHRFGSQARARRWTAAATRPGVGSRPVAGCSERLPSSGPKALWEHGGIVRGDTTRPELALVFTGDSFAEGMDTVRAILADKGVPASFFFTGNFYRNPDFEAGIRGLLEDGHYLGAHSDRHLLYCDWTNRDSLLVTREEFERDVLDNYIEMERFGIAKEDAPYYLPPYEWYNAQISTWTEELGLTLVNFTRGTRSNADYTTEDMGERYVSSETIYRSILEYETRDPNGLNGFLLLIHIGAGPGRPDKFYLRLPDLLDELKDRGYGFVRVSGVF
jgi:endoglucanase